MQEGSHIPEESHHRHEPNIAKAFASSKLTGLLHYERTR